MITISALLDANIFKSTLMTEISIIVPCYNEEENIHSTYERLSGFMNSLKMEYEILFVDNGGTDGQLNEMQSIFEKDSKHVRIVSLSRNFGYQMSLSAGLEYAVGEAVVMIDADLQDPPELIEEFIKKWREGYDVVYGIRSKRKGSFLFRAFYKLFYFFMRKTADIEIPRDSGEFGLMSKKVVEKLKGLPERVRLIRGLRAWIGYKQTGIPYTRMERDKGKTKFRFFDNISLALDGIFSFSTKILSMMAVFGFIITLISFSLLVYILIWRFLSPEQIPGYAAIMVAISFFSGIIVFMLGLIGALVERIFVEVKGRPKFIVNETMGIEP